ncbi:EAL domain-containing protein [Roseococcus sp. SDR]|nr:EAL domain-containing protein [Roseococcus sp. SDR]MBS7791511.1 EAL domain-containing protein [Roseococcus sp. SDR]MBV1846825.1 EAL domain-containing protein [Roseococcus sp. SDR]
MAFQPILNIRTGQVFAQEALVRGADGAGAAEVLSHVTDQNRYAFDQLCRTTAIELAAGLGLAESGAALSVNFLPNAVYEPKACIRLTLATALRHGLPLHQIIFEFTESESLDTAHLLNILRAYKAMGFRTAIDDFGAGYAGLSLLSKFQPDIVKIDMELVRGLDTDRAKRIILRGTLRILAELGIATVCEGVETPAEYGVLRDMGVELMQGYLIGRPALQALNHPPVPPPTLPWPARGGGRSQPAPRMAHGAPDR